MGSTKDEIKKINEKRDTKGGNLKDLLGKLGKSKKKDKDKLDFSDLISLAETELVVMIGNKKNDLDKESGDSEYNQQALGILKTMGFHLDSIIDLAEEYAGLRDEE